MTTRKRDPLYEMPIFPQASPGGTGEVLTRPSELDREIAKAAVKNIDFAAMLRDMGAIAAREFANAAETYALRPADYADPEQAAKLAEDIVRVVLKELPNSDSFARAFQNHLAMRG